jgi:nucleoporin NUP82
LTVWVSSRFEKLGEELPEVSAEETFDRQFRGDTSTTSNARRASSSKAARHKGQLQYVNALNRQVRSARESSRASQAWDDADCVVRIRPPADTGRGLPVRQGPFLLRPAPRELDDAESTGTDLHYFRYTPARNDESEDEDAVLGVFLIASSSGKVDVGLEVETVEAMWQASGYDVGFGPFIDERL